MDLKFAKKDFEKAAKIQADLASLQGEEEAQNDEAKQARVTELSQSLDEAVAKQDFKRAPEIQEELRLLQDGPEVQQDEADAMKQAKVTELTQL